MEILGVRVDEVDMEQAQAAVGELIAAFDHGSAGAQVVTLNPEGLWLAKNDAALLDIVERAALVTADGSGLLWAAEQLDHPLPGRVTGIDLLQRLCAQAARRGWRVFLLGAEEGVARAAARKLQADYPGLCIAGTENGFFREREQQVIADIAAAKADILFAALGMPYQEQWLAEHKQELGCAVLMGVGGSFDVLAGKVRRAPRFLQKLRLEWLWRLLSDPKRWRRYLVIPRFMAAVKKSKRQQAQAK